MALGVHRIEYEIIESLEQVPEGRALVEVAGVACDSEDRVHVFSRGAVKRMAASKPHAFRKFRRCSG
jgi:hypothetical protein